MTGARVQVAHTADLDAPTLGAGRALMRDVFGSELTDGDWEHALGGMHAFVWEAQELVAHGSVVQRRLLYEGRALRTGYVEAVAVRGERQGSGYGAMVMDELERIVAGAYEVGGLGASDAGAGFYAARGWKQWQGQTWALTPDGRVRTADEDDGVFVFECSRALDSSRELTCDWRDGDVW